MKTTISSPITSAKRLLAVSSCIGLLALFSGCVAEPESRVVSAPPPPPPTATTTTTATTANTPVVVRNADGTVSTGTITTTTPTPSTVIVTQTPPALQQETVLARPSAEHVWIPGYYTWRENRYVWIAGRWEMPPRTGAVWVAPRWERESGGYRFYEGYWN